MARYLFIFDSKYANSMSPCYKLEDSLLRHPESIQTRVLLIIHCLVNANRWSGADSIMQSVGSKQILH